MAQGVSLCSVCPTVCENVEKVFVVERYDDTAHTRSDHGDQNEEGNERVLCQ